ncbi:methylated-DNA--protein-cysteine methyltransferase isoform X2 [Narcine bancroftii]|uniref:methylated-DNA--protein-cysteine methyltransferase isoform X2 n=1 Tax=Narcine bancroftii TaxID=1343680 RepID=UPI00383200F9
MQVSPGFSFPPPGSGRIGAAALPVACPARRVAPTLGASCSAFLPSAFSASRAEWKRKGGIAVPGPFKKRCPALGSSAGSGDCFTWLTWQRDFIKKTRVASFHCNLSESQEEMTAPVKHCMTWLEAYFCEPWTTGKLPLPPFHHRIFQQATFTCNVLRILQRDVKFGEVTSYKQLATLAGNSKAVRAVGGAMRSNPVPIIVPCHRVICSNGQTGNYMGGRGNHLKQWLLTHEKLLKESRETSQGLGLMLPHS